jgi:serine/threonine-protein kinase
MAEKAIGRYELKKEIGRGGMATVYLCHDPTFERPVAVKVLPRQFLHDPSFLARFEKEAKSIAAIEHPAIVPVYDFGEDQGQPFLVMRYMQGGSLADRLDVERIEGAEASAIVSRLAAALDEAHDQGLIHRDLKPGNILFDKRGDAHLSDFGIVKLTQETSTFTGTGIVGTPAYMSPEQARGDSGIDRRSDVYSLGVLVYHMLAGKQPYEADTPMGLAVKHITEPVPSLAEERPDLAESYEQLIQRVLAKNADDRPATAGDLAAELHKCVYEMQALDATRLPAMEETAEVEQADEILGEPEPEEVDAEVGLSSTPVPEEVETEVDLPETPDYEEVEEAADIPETPPVEEKVQRKAGVLKTTIGREIEFAPEVKRKFPVWGAIAGGIVVVGLVGVVLTQVIDFGKSQPEPEPAPTQMAAEPTEVIPEEPEIVFPAVEGPNPSYRVAAFYYPWYGNPDFDGSWVHWEQAGAEPPDDIGSDFFPELGAYSSIDPFTVAQHMAWLREAGVGIIISSWWGQGTHEDSAMPILLDTADQYGIKVAPHIEPYGGRTAGKLVEDVRYIYEQYGSHPAFFRLSDTTTYSPDEKPKGVFFVWSLDFPGGDGDPVETDYWAAANDEIHALPDSAIVIGNGTVSDWIVNSRFDGLYNYVTMHISAGEGFEWGRDIPHGALYVPSVVPGFSAQRIGYPDDSTYERNRGTTYDLQWQAALDIEIEPAMVTITSFNEWHEGTQIEPAQAGIVDSNDRAYLDYGNVNYLEETAQWIESYLGWEWPETQPSQIRIITTSDWTALKFTQGGSWLRRSLLTTTGDAAVEGEFLALRQPLDQAQLGSEVEAIFQLEFTGLQVGETLLFGIERGHLGQTVVEFLDVNGVLIHSVRWAGVLEDDANTLDVEVGADIFLGQ